MKNFKNILPAIALAAALSPFVAHASWYQGPSHKVGYFSTTTGSSRLAANSKGRPAEFAPAASAKFAANSKGRPAEFKSEVAVNSKGRPAEFAPAAPRELAANAKGFSAIFTSGAKIG